MTNLSDLLPAGAASKQLSFTASGTIANGQTVILQSDGTVKVVEQTTISEAKGTAVEFESGTTQYTAAAYDTNRNKVLVCYKDVSDSGQGKAVVGTVSGTSITFNTPMTFRNSSGVTGADYIAVAFDSSRNNFAVVWQANYLDRLQGKVLTIQADGSVNDGSFTTIVNNQVSYIAISYSPTADRFLVSYRDYNSSNYGRNVILESNGNTFTVGTPNTFTSNTVEYIDNVYGNTTDDRFVVAYKRSATPYVMSCYRSSGTNVVNQAEYQVATANGDQTKVGYDTAADRYVVAYRDEADSDKVGLKSFAVTTSASAGASTITAVSSEVNTTQTSTNDYAIAYDSNVQKLSLFYRSGTTSYVQKITDSSETGLALGSAFTLDATSNLNQSAVYDPDSKNFVYTYSANGLSNQGRGQVFQPTYTVTNSADFLGIADEAISNGASGNVTMKGGVATNSQLLPLTYTGTLGSEAVFQTSATTYTRSCYDPDSGKTIIAWVGPSDYGYAVVATVGSDNSITYGTAVAFNSVTTKYIAISYDTGQDKVLIVYQDDSAPDEGKAIVGTVSGTSISFGTAVTIYGSNDGGFFGTLAYSPDTANHLTTYNTNGSTSKVTVLTVSGTSVSVGGTANLTSGTVYQQSVTYDTTADKFVVSYRDAGNSNYGTAVVVSVSGTTPSLGTATVFSSATTFQNEIVYDSSNDKVVIHYRGSSPQNPTAIVGTVSGTSISFGSPTTIAVLNDGDSQAITFDSSAGRIIVAYRDEDPVPENGKYAIGTVSGTSISFDTPVTFNAANSTHIALSFNAGVNRNVITYQDGGNSSYGTAIALQLTGAYPNLVPNSTYYVQDDGTLSTTSSSVTAGKAMSTNSINLDYST